jgi:hypothetical protein
MTLVGYPPGMNTIATSSGKVFIFDNTVFASINVNSTAITGADTKANNHALKPISYTFMTTYDAYIDIYSRQCSRVGAFIYDQLDRLDRGDDDYNEEVVEQIASVINMVGEPAYMTAALEARVLEDDRFRLGKLLLAIATSTNKETENERVEFLRRYLSSSDYRVKNSAVRALGRMKTDESKKLLQEISGSPERGEIAHLATALLR